jgi:hypothetical protein
MLRPLPVLLLALVAACGERRDLASVAGGVPPFDELRGTNIAALRVGEVRAFRRAALPAPLEGVRETIGAFDVLYAVPGYDGSNGAWPQEDVQILDVEAAREWPSDSAATEAWLETARRIRNETGATPHCLEVQGPGFSMRVVEFDRGGGWHLSTSVAPQIRLPNRRTVSARQGIAVRHQSVTERFPADTAANADALPVWSRVACPEG